MDARVEAMSIATERLGEIQFNGQMAAGTARVLVVDDDEIIRALMAITLADEGYEVLEAEDGAAALRVASEQPPDLIVLDMNMPRLDGWGFVRQYRKQAARPAPIIISTAAGNAAYCAEALQAAGAVGKPFELDAFCHAVAQHLTPERVA